MATTVAVDVSAPRREMALRLGATHVLDPTDIDVVAAVADVTGGGGTHALDTTGVPAVIAAAVKGLAPTGAAVVVGLGGGEVPLEVLDLLYGGKTLRGCVEGDAVPAMFVPYLLDLHVAGRFPVDTFVETFPLARIDKAVEAHRTSEVVKAVLMP